MLWIKAFHILFASAWFAGLFYLPRIYVNLAMVPADSVAERDRLLLMARKLYRFSMILMLVAIGLGLWLTVGWFGGSGGWLHAKIVLVVLTGGYQYLCKRHLKAFEAGTNTRSHVWFRVFNEISVLLFGAIIVLVVLKPF